MKAILAELFLLGPRQFFREVWIGFWIGLEETRDNHRTLAEVRELVTHACLRDRKKRGIL